MSYDKIISIIRKHPIMGISMAFALGGVTTYSVVSQRSSQVITGCLTETVGGDQSCVKYSYPPLQRLGRVDTKACPSPPPAYNCP